jgi:uncharacterized membrane protein
MKNQVAGLHPSYSAIGVALTNYDYNCFCEKIDEELAFSAFREDLVFMQVEVLESYLEDLLNLKMSDEYLCISKDYSRWPTRVFEVAIALFAVCMGAVSALLGATQTMAYALTFISIIPLFFIYYLSPRSTRRRMRFARLISREISRRRGHDKDGEGRSGISIGDFFMGASSSGIHGAAKVTVH